jgi:inner membrane protein
MANRKQHIILGAAAGVGGCAVYSYIKEEKPSWPELIGSGLSGAAGSLLPDLIEPATNPNHRSFFHSVSFAAVAGPTAGSWAWRFRDEQIRRAEECELRANAALDGFEKILWKLQAFLHRFLAGAVPGLILGYASHLAADALTPKGLPLLG